MYAIGSQVVHPCHGAGTIVSIERKRIGEREHAYYVVDILDTSRHTQVMVPVRRAEAMGLRPVGRPSRLRALLARCRIRPKSDQVVRDFRRRRAVTAEQLKSGSFRQIVDMVRALASIGTQRTLSFSDRERLQEGKQMLAAELALAAEQHVDEALKEVEGQLAQMAPADPS